MTVKVQIQGKQFQQRQAKIYYNVYQEIWQATDYFCKQHGIDVVLQVKGDAVDPEVAESVIPFINKQVVWFAPDLEITDQILADLNKTAINPQREADGAGADAARGSVQRQPTAATADAAKIATARKPARRGQGRPAGRAKKFLFH